MVVVPPYAGVLLAKMERFSSQKIKFSLFTSLVPERKIKSLLTLEKRIKKSQKIKKLSIRPIDKVKANFLSN